MRTLLSITALAVATSVYAAPPALDVWLDWTGATGWGGFPANVDSVQFSVNDFYVEASGIPEYDIGPWPFNPNEPEDKNYLLRFPTVPRPKLGPKVATPLGHIGLWINGVPVYNFLDGHSWEDEDVWHQNAVVAEAESFDSCLGHPAGQGQYHHHQNPVCLYEADPSVHSPILGYAFDGFPIYGPYAYANPDGSGGIVRMTTGFRTRDIVHRRVLPDGTMLPEAVWGPDVGATYPLGTYGEDFIYEEGLGILDTHNGRITETPEYPYGTYAYFVTIDAAGASEFPYSLGPTYYGIPAQDSFHNNRVTISGTVRTYHPDAVSVPDAHGTGREIRLANATPNPSRGDVNFGLALPRAESLRSVVIDAGGRVVRNFGRHHFDAGSQAIAWDGRNDAGGEVAAGVYFLRVSSISMVESAPVILIR